MTHMVSNGKRLGTLAAAMALCMLAAGCHVFVAEGVEVWPHEEIYYVHEGPPPDRVEVIGISPGPDYFWIGGCWEWHNRWVWAHGYWAPRPHPGAVWVSGRWTHNSHGWAHNRGHWH